MAEEFNKYAPFQTMSDSYYDDNKRYISQSEFDLTPITYADRGLGPALHNLITKREGRLDSLYNIFENFAEGHQDWDSGDTRKVFEKAINDLNSYVYASVGAGPSMVQGIGGVFEEGGKAPYFGTNPDTTFYSPIGVDETLMTARDAVGVLMHEGLLHGAGFYHEFDSIYDDHDDFVDIVEVPGTSQEDYNIREKQITSLFTDEEIDELVDLMYDTPPERPSTVSPGLSGKRQ